MITVTIETNKIKVISEYSSLFVQKAHDLGGVWKAPCWEFDVRNEEAVRAACLYCYGDDGIKKDQVDVRITLPNGDKGLSYTHEPLEILGRTVARAFGRDSARTSPGVVIESGGFGSGGSLKNWYVVASKGTTFLLRDVSRSLVVENTDENIQIEILEGPDKEALKEEREKLIARLAQINELLADN